MKSKILLTFIILASISLRGYSFAEAETVDISAIVPGCGDGIVQSGEQCDGSNVGGASCVSQGFSSGTISCTASCTFNTLACVESSGGSGGGGGGSTTPVSVAPIVDLESAVIMEGLAYRNSNVFILKDGQLVKTIKADSDASFSVSINDITPGVHNLSIYAVDSSGRRSLLQTYTVDFIDRAQVSITNIFLPPTLSLSSQQIPVGGYLTLEGESVPSSLAVVFLNGSAVGETYVSAQGRYALDFYPSQSTLPGSHNLKVLSRLPTGTESAFSGLVSFVVGDVLSEPSSECSVGDQNCDGGIDVLDFSIMAFWFEHENPPVEVDLNADGRITIEDFSILAYYWSS